MKAQTWRRICEQIEAEMHAVEFRRGEELYHSKWRGRDGIMVMDDPLARRAQRLEAVRMHAGVHFCIMRDRERGMRVGFPCIHFLLQAKKEQQ